MYTRPFNIESQFSREYKKKQLNISEYAYGPYIDV